MLFSATYKPNAESDGGKAILRCYLGLCKMINQLKKTDLLFEKDHEVKQLVVLLKIA